MVLNDHGAGEAPGALEQRWGSYALAQRFPQRFSSARSRNPAPVLDFAPMRPLRLAAIPLFAFAFPLGAAAVSASAHGHADPVSITVYKSPTCGCCKTWVEHLRKEGFDVTAKDVDDMAALKTKLGVPASLGSCHTGIVGAYIIEGHVPGADIRKLLTEKPKIAGLAVPGMPVGSPGMEMPGVAADKYDVIAFAKDGKHRVFASH